MKRIITVLLSVCLILGSVTGLSLGTVSAESTNTFETLTNWIMGDQTSTEITNVAKYDNAKTLVSGTDVPNSNSESALKMYYKSNPLRGSVKLNGLAKKTDYRVTVSFYSDDYSTSNNCIIREAGIYTPDATGASLKWQTGGYKGYLNVMTYNVTQRSVPDAVSYSSATAVDSGLNTTVTNYPTGKWNTLIFTFNTAEFANIYLTLLAETNCTVYVDDIAIEKLTSFEETSSWMAVGSGEQAVPASSTVTDAFSLVSGGNVPGRNSAFAIKYSKSYASRAILKLNELEANTEYCLSVSFYSDNYSTANNCILRQVGVFTSDVTDASLTWVSGSNWTGYLGVMANNVNQISMPNATYSQRFYSDGEKNTTITNYPAKTWNTLTFTFNTKSFKNIYFAALVEGGCDVYFDDIKVEKCSYYDSRTNWIIDDQTSAALGDRAGALDTLIASVNGSNVASAKTNSVLKLYREAGPLRASVKLAGLNAGTTYNLKVSFYSDDYSTSNNCIIREAGIYTPDATGANLKYQSGIGYKGYLNVMTYNVTQRSVPDAVSYSSATAVDSGLNTTVTNYPTGKWNTLSFTFNTGDFNNIYFTALMETNCTVYLDDITVTEMYTGKTAYNSAAALRAADSTDGSVNKNGMRIYNSISTKWIDSSNVVEYGSLAARKNSETFIAANSELTLETAKTAKIAKGVAYSEGTSYSEAKSATLWKIDDDNDQYIFTSYLTGINPEYYGETYVIRTYAVTADTDGNEQVFYGEEFEISVFAVANAIDNSNTVDGTARSEYDVEAFKNFVTNSADTVASYLEWCNANDKSTGDLYEEYLSAE